MRVITFKMDEDLLMSLDRYAMKYRLNRSEMIRKAIEKMVREEMRKEKGRARVKVVKV
ncbi:MULTISPECIES: ribbon-helix-helix protein, CopG family [Metallosphaera]|uniref:ribbon-helix-helix protein, CopG family n=1 Tax=Metallosphaera TaxID=41980 RepID=UPI00298A0496|nr:ribbon-helix-helix protein, CopG family [Metallosphaera sedula]MCP6728441.1 ribbon-helix-helix protein, CopG family [Metallosphaera sedula]